MSTTPPLLPSRIIRVTVFRLGAEVVREALLEPAGGALPEAVALGGLPLGAPEGSFQVRIEPMEGEGEAALPVATGLTLDLQPPPPDPDLPPATDEELRAAERTLERCQGDQALLERQLAALEDLESPDRPAGAEGEPPPAPPTAARLVLLALRRDEQERLLGLLVEAREATRLAKEALAIQKARRVRDAHRRQLAPHELRRQALVALQPSLEGRPAGRCRLCLTYLVPAARWSPSYHIAVDPKAGRATLAMRAVVCQAGDEDWLGVALTLSTADALQWAELPKLHPLRIGRARSAAPATGWRPPPIGAEALYADYDLGFGEREPPPRSRAAPAASGAMPPRGAPAARAPAPPEREREMASMRDMIMEMAAEEACDDATPMPAKRSASLFARNARPRREAKAMASSHAMDLPAPQAAPMAGEMAFQAAAYGAGAAPPEGPPPGLAAADSLLAYDALWMPGPEDRRRGRLRTRSPEEQRRAGLSAELRRRLPPPDALQRHLATLAAGVQGLPLPPGHRAPRREGAFDHAWRAEQPVDVPGDGRFHNVAVITADLPARLRYIAVPREAREVYRSLRLENALSSPLLEGPVDVDLDRERLPTARLPVVAAGPHADLGLGVEEGIKLARNTRFSEQSRGMVSRHLDLQHEIEIELRSLLAHSAELEVRERLPAIREGDDDIEVSERGVEPAWEPWEPEDDLLRGGRRWQLSLPAGEVRRLRAAYTISISAKHELVGGNRRED